MESIPRHLWRTSLTAAVPAHSGASWAAIGVVVFLVAAGGLLLRPSLASLTALRRYAAATRAQAVNDITKTGDADRLSQEAAEAYAAVPWWLGWLRQPVWRHIERDLDYFRRTGQS